MARKGGKRQTARRGKPPAKSAPSLPFPKPYTVEMTASAEAVYKELRRLSMEAEAKGEPASQHCTTFRMVHPEGDPCQSDGQELRPA